MNGFVQFFKNLCYLSKFSLKTKLIQNPTLKFTYEDIIENILYYIPDSNVIRPKILDKKSTINILVNSNLSLARFGDGEINLIMGISIPFQKNDKELASKLAKILKNKQENLIVGIPYDYYYCKYNSNQNQFIKDFELTAYPLLRKNFLEYIDLHNTYCDTGFNGITMLEETEYNELKKIWNNRNILIVACKEALKKIKYNIYNNAKQIDYIFVPNKDSFSEYKQTLNKIEQYDKNTLIILMGGPLSKVLASDLSNIGYRALDLGHLMKSYDYYKRGIEVTPEAVEEFYQPDV